MYGFGSGYFHTTCKNNGIPFKIIAAVDPITQGRQMFQSIINTKRIYGSALQLLIAAKTLSADVQGYYITFPLSPKRNLQINFF